MAAGSAPLVAGDRLVLVLLAERLARSCVDRLDCIEKSFKYGLGFVAVLVAIHRPVDSVLEVYGL